MSLLSPISKRRALRALSTEEIPKEILLRLVEAAHSAPSGGNSQPWRIITVVETEQLNRLKETLTSGNYWAKQAPVITAFVTNPAWSIRLDERDFAYFELGMAAMAYQLQATEENLIAHPMAGFDASAAKRVLEIPEEDILQVLIAVGYQNDESFLSPKHQEMEKSLRTRRPLEEIAAFDVWQPQLTPEKRQ